jgi:hypothetical protein
MVKMKPFEYTSQTEMVINESGNLQQFYRVANVLSKTRHVHLMSKKTMHLSWNGIINIAGCTLIAVQHLQWRNTIIQRKRQKDR